MEKYLLINISPCELSKPEGFFHTNLYECIRNVNVAYCILGKLWPTLFLKQKVFFKSGILWAGSDFSSNKNVMHGLLTRMYVIKFTSAWAGF